MESARVPVCSSAIEQDESLAKTATADSGKGCHVIRSLRDWVRDRDRRPDLCRILGSHGRTLDGGGRGRTFRGGDSDRCKGDTSERSFLITILSESDSRLARQTDLYCPITGGLCVHTIRPMVRTSETTSVSSAISLIPK